MLEIADRFGPEAKILTMIPDGGRNYLSKFYDDNWMLDHGFLERRAPTPTVEQVLRSKQTEEPDIPDLVTIAANQKVGAAIDLMQRYSISQLPVIRDGEVESLADVIGSLQDRDLLDRVFKNPDALHEDVVAAMQPPLAAIDAGEPLDEVFSTLSGRTNAVVVAQAGRPVGVLTRTDLLEYLAHNAELRVALFSDVPRKRCRVRRIPRRPRPAGRQSGRLPRRTPKAARSRPGAWSGSAISIALP